MPLLKTLNVCESSKSCLKFLFSLTNKTKKTTARTINETQMMTLAKQNFLSSCDFFAFSSSFSSLLFFRFVVRTLTELRLKLALEIEAAPMVIPLPLNWFFASSSSKSEMFSSSSGSFVREPVKVAFCPGSLINVFPPIFFLLISFTAKIT